MATASEGSVVDNLREAAGKVQAKVSEMFQGTKQFVGEATERVKADGETYAGAIKEQASKAKDAASVSYCTLGHPCLYAVMRMARLTGNKAHSLADRAVTAAENTATKYEGAADRTAGKASELGERAAAAAAEGNAAAVDAAIGGQAGSHDVATGIRGPGVVAERMDAVPENQKPGRSAGVYDLALTSTPSLAAWLAQLPRSCSAMEVEIAFKLTVGQREISTPVPRHLHDILSPWHGTLCQQSLPRCYKIVQLATLDAAVSRTELEREADRQRAAAAA
ncbi:hypothetical protein HaLaN_18217, partial [Haematococcus lacustris]